LRMDGTRLPQPARLPAAGLDRVAGQVQAAFGELGGDLGRGQIGEQGGGELGRRFRACGVAISGRAYPLVLVGPFETMPLDALTGTGHAGARHRGEMIRPGC
jgi:hypothetical protein